MTIVITYEQFKNVNFTGKILTFDFILKQSDIENLLRVAWVLLTFRIYHFCGDTKKHSLWE